MMINYIVRLATMAMIFLLGLQSNEFRAETLIKVNIIIEASPCIVNDGVNIEVNFNGLFDGNINGINYLRTMDYSLKCNHNITNAMKLQIMGAPVSFDGSALQTNIQDFGIAFRVNKIPLKINEWVKFSYPHLPEIQVVPVKKAGRVLPKGKFRAVGVLMIAYQ